MAPAGRLATRPGAVSPMAAATSASHWVCDRGVLRKPIPRCKETIIRGAEMKDCDLKSMSVEELWTLHEETVAALARKIIAEKARLEQRLHELGQDNGARRQKAEPCAASLPPGVSQISKPRRTRRDLGRPRQAAAVARCATPVREKARRLPDPAGLSSGPAPRRIGGDIAAADRALRLRSCRFPAY